MDKIDSDTIWSKIAIFNATPTRSEVKEMMKETARQALILASKKAKTMVRKDYGDRMPDMFDVIVDEKSILDIIDLIV